MPVKFLDLYKQYLSIKPEIDQAIADVISQSAYVSGRFAARFEKEFAAFEGAEYCVGCGNGTDAIEICLEALDLPRDAEIIVPANTFIATAEAVTRAGFRVVFCDCDPQDYTISLESLERKMTPRTAAVVVVHLYGQPCNMDPIMEFARAHNLKVIEDSSQAHGADYKGRRVGTIGDCGTFSFYPGKNLGAYGDAGVMVTNDAKFAERVRMIANHGRIAKYDHEFEGRNSRLDGIQGAVLTAKLAHLEDWTQKRVAIASHYKNLLSGVGDLILPTQRNWGRHVYHVFAVRTKMRDALQAFLKSRGIETGIHYPISLPKLRAYAYLGQAREEFAANHMDQELLSLPMGDHLEAADVAEVASVCREFFATQGRM